jgi:hypothetical protein
VVVPNNCQCMNSSALFRASFRKNSEAREEDGRAATLYGRNMYEHHLPLLTAPLTTNCGVEALRLVVTLLSQAGDEGPRSCQTPCG